LAVAEFDARLICLIALTLLNSMFNFTVTFKVTFTVNLAWDFSQNLTRLIASAITCGHMDIVGSGCPGAASGRQQSGVRRSVCFQTIVIKEGPQMRTLFQRMGDLQRKARREMGRRSPGQRRMISAGLGLMVILLLGTVAIMPRISRASEMNALGNGGFEGGFRQIPGCGIVGVQWECFTNGGAANYGFYDDQWEPVVYAGKFSQLIEINTKGLAAGDNDRFAGLAQTARVVPGESYKLSLRGMIRSTSTQGDPWRYSVQVGWLEGPRGDWQDVTNWTDTGWNTFFARETPGAFSAFEARFVPKSEVITVFVRVWKKWGVAFEELDVNLDEIALEGPSAQRPMGKDAMGQAAMGQAEMSQMPMMGGTGGPMGDMSGMARPSDRPGSMPAEAMQAPMQAPMMPMGKDMPAMEAPMTYRPQIVTGESMSCSGQNLIFNGSFEQGFVAVPWGEVGRGWEAFTNGGAANYGFYDEQWDIVVADGDHGQLIEINSKAVFPTDPDRYAGIAQRIGGLKPGQVYEFTVRGGLRGVGNEEDPTRFAAEWGISSQPNWQSVDEWTYMDFGPIQVRTEPSPLAQYRVRFEAPSQSIVLFIRGWKKWAITNVEMDFNLDAISLRACDSQGMWKAEMAPMQPQGMPMAQGMPQEMPMRPTESAMQPMRGQPTMPEMGSAPMRDEPMRGEPMRGEAMMPAMGGASCFYIVKPGDSLSAIAVRHDVSMSAIARANGVSDPDAIYVGQKFEIPGCSAGEAMMDRSSMQNAPMQDAPMARPEMADMPLTGDLSMRGERPMDAPQMTGPMLRPDGDMAMMDAPMMDAPMSRGAMNAEAPQMMQGRGTRTYVVQPGDMLTRIALDEGINAFDLAATNGIDNMNMIYVGQVLVIPN
jgi:LysM repeat protein